MFLCGDLPRRLCRFVRFAFLIESFQQPKKSGTLSLRKYGLAKGKRELHTQEIKERTRTLLHPTHVYVQKRKKRKTEISNEIITNRWDTIGFFFAHKTFLFFLLCSLFGFFCVGIGDSLLLNNRSASPFLLCRGHRSSNRKTVEKRTRVIKDLPQCSCPSFEFEKPKEIGAVFVKNRVGEHTTQPNGAQTQGEREREGQSNSWIRRRPRVWLFSIRK